MFNADIPVTQTSTRYSTYIRLHSGTAHRTERRPNKEPSDTSYRTLNVTVTVLMLD